LANNVPDIVYSLDGEGKIVTVNSQAFERYGYTEQNSRGKPFLTFIHPEDREIVLQSFLNAMQEQRKFTHGLQFRIVAGDGASYWFELNSQARFDTAGRYLGEDGVLRDISERKRVEQALQKKETEYQTLVQNLMVGIVVHDPSTAILFSNAAASNLLGLTKEQLQGKSAMDPDWRFLRDDGTNMPLSEYPVNRVLSSGKEIYNFVAGISRRDKDKPVWVLCVAYPVYDMQDQLLQIVVTFSDITDRKQAEQDLRRSNDRYEQIVNTVPVMLYDYILRPDGVSDFLYVSPKMCREILELDSEAVLADMDLFWNMAHPQDISRLHQEDVMANLEGKLFYSEFRMIMPSGKMKWVSLNSKPRSVSPGEPAVWSGFLQDITERKEAEEALLKKMDELERFQRLTVGRELRMIELKKEVNHLLQQTGQQEKYRIVDEK
jgi:PAS domain S-box-containing protein